jgi:hypothetical protein
MVIKVLHLDDNNLDMPLTLPKNLDIELEFVSEFSLGVCDLYHPRPDLLGKIAQITGSGEIGIVIVGNNRGGAGIKKAAMIAPHLQGSTLVVWNHYVPGMESPEYVEMGFRNFTTRGSERTLQFITNVLTRPGVSPMEGIEH